MKIPSMMGIGAVVAAMPAMLLAQGVATEIQKRMAAEMQKKIAAAEALPTPKAPDGHPDLSGYWGAYDLDALIVQIPKRKIDYTGKQPVTGGGESDELKADATGPKARWADKSLRPVYKPGLQKKQEDNFIHADFLDPAYRCQPDGVPRLGAPTEILQTRGATFFLYKGLAGLGNTYRLISTDGRGHDPDADAMSMGDSVGRWDGNTFVIDVVNFSPDTWIDRDGSWHDENMHVTERFTRKGNVLHYSVRVEDPTLFAQPFEPKPTTLVLGPAGKHANEAYPCEEKDQGHMVSDERH